MYVLICDTLSDIRDSVITDILSDFPNKKYNYVDERSYTTYSVQYAKKWKTEAGAIRFAKRLKAKSISNSFREWKYDKFKVTELKAHKLTDEEVNEYINQNIEKAKRKYERYIEKQNILRRKLLR